MHQTHPKKRAHDKRKSGRVEAPTLSTSSPVNSAYTSSAIACASAVLGADPISRQGHTNNAKIL